MRAGDIDVRLKGARLRDFNEEQLAEFILACTRLLQARVITVRSTHLVFRPVPPKEAPACDSNT